MSLLHPRLRMARRWLWNGLALGVVAAAVVFGAASQLLPLAERHPDRIAAWLAQRIDRPVAFDRVETRWTRRGPLLRLDNLRLGEGRQAIRVGDAEMLISQYAGLLPGRSFTELRLRGLDLTLERRDDGRWEIRGLPGQQTAQGDPFEALEGLGELQVIGGRLAISAPKLHLQARIPRVDLRLRVDGAQVRLGMRAWMQSGGEPVLATAQFDRDSGDGRVHALARKAQLRAWSPLLEATGIALRGGHGRGEAWVQLHDRRVAALWAEGDFDGVRLDGAPLADGTPTRLALPQLQARARWRKTAGGWRVAVPHLRVRDADGEHVLDGLALAAVGERRQLQAPRLDAGPLLAAAALSERLAPAWRTWFARARPHASAHDLALVAGPGGQWQVQGRLEQVGFAPVGHAPGLDGLAGQLQADPRGLAFVAERSAAVRVDWPGGFAAPQVFHLGGTLAGWREGGGWRVATSGLQLRGREVGLDLRGGFAFHGDGTRPRIDLAADVRPTPVVAAKGFWLHHLMPPASVRWLDAALQGGRIEEAHALVCGDLDDWPFREAPGNPARGLFQVRARIADGTLRFHPGWPAAAHVDADLLFLADGFRMAGKGVVDGVGVRHFEAGIEHFGDAQLRVRAQGGGDASRLLALLRDSPLREAYGATLAQLSARGLAAVTFGLELPLHGDAAAAHVQGDVVLAGARLAAGEWNLVFDEVRGRARYDNGGFSAEGLSVRHEGAPGRLSLRAGDGARDPDNAFEATLEANLPAQKLLQRVPELAWLQPHVSGRSDWRAQLALPRATGRPGRAPAGRLRLQSSLAGTALALPAPLRKAAAAALPTHIETTLPLDAGEVRVALGTLAGVRARSHPAAGVRVVLGSARVEQPPPQSGLVVGGRAASLDALDWIAVAKSATTPASSAATGGPGLPLREVDVRVDQLQLLGARFSDTRVRLAPVTGGLAATLEGEALQGSVRVPDAGDATVTGRFARVHWRAMPHTGAGSPPAAAPDEDPIDPARLPPLAIDVASLRFNHAVLGQASLRTVPVADGLRIERLQAATPGQRIGLTGDWLGTGSDARTRLEATVQSGDFGALLAGLGYGGQLNRGEGRAVLEARWRGGPSAFSLAGMDGRLTLDVRDGQLTEIDPGAGRVLGLLSVAQLPRRLSLDFRDLFSKGFAFDALAGQVRLAGGRASSEGLRIGGPAADIRITGSADLRAQTFNQTIQVEPRAGNLLTVAGAIAGGPVGAAIGAAANAMLRKPLGELAARTYHVTGPWKDPHVEVVGRETAVAAGASPPPG